MIALESWFHASELASWRSVLDIALIAALIFFTYRTLIRMGTWKIVSGIIIAATIFLLSSFLDLKGIAWIYSNVSQVAAIAVVVIFQPELRKFFERAASVRRSKSGDAGDDVAGLIAESAWQLARQRRGAIVVFPGKEPVGEWLAGGYPLDAKPSQPLLMSIFDPNSPGHDGALIVEKGRFARFGLRLPVSETSRLSADYGTRHHAAMGMAEKSDSLVLVVSEERGRLSLFQRGVFRPIDSPAEAEEAIEAHWKSIATYPFEIPPGRGRWMLLSQLAASLVLALVLWSTLIVAQSEILERVLTVPIEYTATPASLVMIGQKADNARIHLSGSKSVLDVLQPSQMSLKVDLVNAVEGKQTILLTEKNIRLPKRITLLDVEPASIDVDLAAMVERDILIVPQLVGKLPKEILIRSIQLNPDRVRVTLPASQGKKNPIVITTTPIYLESLQDDIQLFCKIIAPPTVQPLAKNWPDIEVNISLQR
ncbi:MAG: diadenylate cyclase [Desulfobacterales bacterium]|nr:diadenylate cyclase [Desulfobacterales bacterium]